MYSLCISENYELQNFRNRVIFIVMLFETNSFFSVPFIEFRLYHLCYFFSIRMSKHILPKIVKLPQN